jgi:hypothetical protein
MDIAKHLLVWKAFVVGDSAKLLCISVSKKDFFNVCSAQFEINHPPALIIGNSAEMEDYIKIDSQVLDALTKNDNGDFQRFVTEIHNCLQNGQTLNQVKAKLLTERFWENFKIVYKEIRSIISFKI